MDGLRTLAACMQALDALIDSEGGSKQDAARISLAFQRLSNTFLERHDVEEERWKK